MSRTLLRRALLLVQAICQEAELRGWQILSGARDERASGVTLVIGEQTYPMQIQEQTEPIPFTDRDIQHWRSTRWRNDDRNALPPPQLRRRKANGKLTLSLPTTFRGQRSTWADGKRGLIETKLASFFSELEARAERDTQRSEELTREAAKREREQEQRQTERQRVERLERDVAAWQKAAEIRAYVAVVRSEATVSPSNEDADELRAWCEWARSYADELDPVTSLGAP